MKKELASPKLCQFLIETMSLASLLFFSMPSFGQSYEDGTIYLKVADTSNVEIGYPPPQGIGPGGQQDLYNIFNQYGVTSVNKPFVVLQAPQFDRVYKVYFDPSFSVDNFVTDLLTVPFVEFAEKVPFKTFSQAIPDDPLLPYQLDLVNAFEAFDIHQGGNAVVAITENAIKVSHEDLAGNIVNAWDVADNDNDPNPPLSWFPNPTNSYTSASHGTHVSGIAGGVTNNTTGIASAGWGNKLMPIKITPDNGSPSNPAFGYEGIAYAVANGADVVNCSWSGPFPSQAEYMVVENARQNDVVLVASAGNNNATAARYPAAYGEGTTGEPWEASDPMMVLAVASVDPSGDRSEFSSYGPWVDVAGYGEGILSTIVGFENGMLTDEYSEVSGTSMAAPLVAGIIGLMISYDVNKPIDEVLNCILNTANDVYDPVENPSNLPSSLGTGVINAYDAMRCMGVGCNDPIAVIIPSSMFICQNGTVSLTGYQGDSYLWSTGETDETITISQAGTYSLTITFTGGCTASTSIEIDPAMTEALAILEEDSGLFPNDGILCLGGTSSVGGCDIILGAYWGSEYIWVTNGGNPNSNDGVICGALGSDLPVTLDIEITVIDVGGCPGVTDVVEFTVIALEAPEVNIQIAENAGTPNDGIICLENPENVVLTASGGEAYQWSTGETTPSITVTPAATTTYTVTVSNANECFETSEVTIEVLHCEFLCPCQVGTDIGTPLETTYLSDVPGIGASLTGCVAIAGELRVDQDLLLTNADVRMQPGSSIVVEGSNTLTIDNASHLHGCPNMWEGIKLNPGSYMVSNGNSIIEDAIVAVNSNGGNFGLDLQNTLFNRNWIGIMGNSQFFTLNSVAGCTFDCTTPLSTPMTGALSYTGIMLSNSGAVDVTGGGQPVVFQNLHNGIISENTELTVNDAEFRHLRRGGGHTISGTGIHASGDGELLYVTRPTVFDDCLRGIVTDGVDAYIIRTDMDNVNIGIIAKNGADRNLLISRNDIDAQATGIWLDNSDPALWISVKDNDIRVDQFPPTIISTNPSGILVTENGIPQPNVYIKNNIIETALIKSGINLMNSNGPTVRCNFITPVAGTESGILLENSPNLQVGGNTVTAQSTPFSPANQGIRAIGSTGVVYDCNKMFNTGIGLQFDMGCNDSQVKTSLFSGNIWGLHYKELGVTGQQPVAGSTTAHGNRWVGIGAGGSGARHESPFEDFYSLSRYIVPDPSQPTFPPNPFPNDPQWFDDDDEFNEEDCSFINTCIKISVPVEPTTDLDTKIADGTFTTGGIHEVPMKWMVEKHLYEKLSRDNSLIVPGTVYESFYNSKAGTAMAALTYIKLVIEDLFELDGSTETQLTDLYDQRLAVMDSIYVLDSLLETATGGVAQQLENDKAFQLDELANISATNKALVKSIKAGRSLQADAIIAQNANINAIEVYEQHEKTVNDLFLRSVVKGIPLDNQQVATLEHIGLQCPYTDGSAVFRARALVAGISELVFDDSIACGPADQKAYQGQNPSIEVDQTHHAVSVFPNPAKGQFTVWVGHEYEDTRTVSVLDANGRVVMEDKWLEGVKSRIYNTGKIPLGIYFVHIKEGHNILPVQKLVIID